MKLFRLILLALLVPLALFAAKNNKKGKSPLDIAVEQAATRPYGLEAAREFVKHMTVADGYEVTVFAAEPQLRKPSNIDVDERGRVWVSEIANYGSSRKPWGTLDPKGDRIMVLEDTNGDGEADKSTIFYQGHDIDSPYGVCVVGDRLFVGRSPDMYVFTGADSGHSTGKKAIFSDIAGFDSDHCAHNFLFGPDGKLYFNIGNHSGQLKMPNGQFAVDTDGYEVSVDGTKVPEPRNHTYHGGLAFRCNLDGSELETLAHNLRNPMDLCFDSYGTMFDSDNDDDGNKGTRVMYLMEHGNFGLVDEMTGAGWHEPRSNIEPDIPHRHWHQNDPGVIPNLLFTGAGAPCAMTVYEGDLMPELRGAILHCDASPREVRAYFTKPDGAGYKAEIKILVTSKDTWFRPCDVCVGPDGAIYIADWHDGMVGGHDISDRDPAKLHGRVYRLAPKGSKPTVPKFDFATAKGCVEAMKSSNLAARARAWLKLNELGAAAENDLLTLWQSNDPLWRARVLQLLARIPDRAEKYLDQATHDADPNIRITSLRVAHGVKADIVRYVGFLVNDANPQVRRECAIALRRNTSSDAARLWAQLAAQHDGKDRWYLEALGIGANNQDEKFFQAWLKQVVGHWDTPAGRDIIWRIRAPSAAAYLVKLIADPNTPDQERPRYFRELDFLKGPEKEKALIDLLSVSIKGEN